MGCNNKDEAFQASVNDTSVSEGMDKGLVNGGLGI